MIWLKPPLYITLEDAWIVNIVLVVISAIEMGIIILLIMMKRKKSPSNNTSNKSE